MFFFRMSLKTRSILYQMCVLRISFTRVMSEKSVMVYRLFDLMIIIWTSNGDKILKVNNANVQHPETVVQYDFY